MSGGIKDDWWKLQKERQDATKKLMHDWDTNYYYPKMKALRLRCAEETGHKFKFSHFGPIGHVWSYCTLCGTSQVENP